MTTTSRGEVDWLTEQMGRVFPEEWERFARASGRRDDERLVEAYARATKQKRWPIAGPSACLLANG